ncbi:hypothetical protein [Calothrix sp. NIES-3974]|uniref:hypothetical protein n=1 Tax=Calothrix sp. NIES-3974 TaxID=2005462 RepID=UPI000B5E93F1|nr:hypothetical protein [Calothrix sp. NIES-3974]BAZ03733.1 hypothetical protein NIES3974_03630 [Calothrix sp. NIES-3974]
MNTHIFDNHYLTCPLCHHHIDSEKVKTCVGLFSCPYCQEKFVISKSGHYVRDPFVFKQVALATTLRRQSHPLARIIRDLLFMQRPVVAFLLGTAVLLGTLTLTQQRTNQDFQPSSNQEQSGK